VVFRAVPLTRDAVSSYLAFSPLPALFSKNRRSFFCDTFRRREFSFAAPAYFTRHAAVWCSDFPLANSRRGGTHQRSSAIGLSLPQPTLRAIAAKRSPRREHGKRQKSFRSATPEYFQARFRTFPRATEWPARSGEMPIRAT